jgi:hypothetical protein
MPVAYHWAGGPVKKPPIKNLKLNILSAANFVISFKLLFLFFFQVPTGLSSHGITDGGQGIKVFFPLYLGVWCFWVGEIYWKHKLCWQEGFTDEREDR